MRLDKHGCVVLAAGEGKRMHAPHSKVLCEVAFKPLLGWVIDAVRATGIRDICVVASSEDVKQAAEGCVIMEQHERLGTGHAVMCARDFLQNRGGHTLVLCGDAPFIDAESIVGALALHEQSGSAVTVISAMVENPAGYGRILREQGALAAIVEDSDCDAETRAIHEINAGAYWFNTEKLLTALDKIKPNNAQGEYYLTDAVAILLDAKESASCYTAANADIALGANRAADLLMLNDVARNNAIAKHLTNGVHLLCRDGIVIGPDVEIEPGVQILPGCLLRGRTKIGAGSVIGPNTILDNTTVGSNTKINASQCADSTVGDGATIGPFVQLRPNSHIGDKAKIGNFVEVKNSTVGDGTSLAHLTYIGDSDIGKHCNFGCGVVVVNYDGEQKFRTTVKDYAFIGCNTNLVAPVTVGEGAYTAAGVTVTEDVPDGALAIGRAKQENKLGWAASKLQKYKEKKSKR